MLIVLLASISSVSAVELTNSTLRDTTDTAYPDTLFYLLFAAGAICLLIDVFMLMMERAPPPSAMIVVSTIGFALFLITAYMAPMVAKFTIVATETEVRNVATYILSPAVSYLCLGLATICFLLIWLGVVRLWQLFAANQKRLNNPDFQFESYLRGD